MSGDEHSLRRRIGALWWIAFPPFLFLVLRFSYERVCLQPHDFLQPLIERQLLQPLMERQASAFLVAAIYLGGYLWFVSAAVLTARAWDRRAAGGQLRAIWGSDRFKLLASAAALAVEQVPRAVWEWLFRLGAAC